MTTHYFRAIEGYDGAITIRPGDVLRADVRRPIDVTAFLPVAVQLLDGPPSPDIEVRTVTPELFLPSALPDADWFVGASATVH